MTEARSRGSAGIIRGLRAAIEEFASLDPQGDDITAVVCKVGAAP